MNELELNKQILNLKHVINQCDQFERVAEEFQWFFENDKELDIDQNMFNQIRESVAKCRQTKRQTLDKLNEVEIT